MGYAIPIYNPPEDAQDKNKCPLPEPDQLMILAEYCLFLGDAFLNRDNATLPSLKKILFFLSDNEDLILKNFTLKLLINRDGTKNLFLCPKNPLKEIPLDFFIEQDLLTLFLKE